MTVLTVIASDVDQGNNGSVHYSLKQTSSRDNQPMFSINSHTGLISTMLDNVLDRETQEEYQIIVQAKDKGSPPMSCKSGTILQLHTFFFHINLMDIEFYGVLCFQQVPL
jgi:hypothetical protein